MNIYKILDEALTSFLSDYPILLTYPDALNDETGETERVEWLAEYATRCDLSTSVVSELLPLFMDQTSGENNPFLPE